MKFPYFWWGEGVSLLPHFIFENNRKRHKIMHCVDLFSCSCTTTTQGFWLSAPYRALNLICNIVTNLTCPWWIPPGRNWISCTGTTTTKVLDYLHSTKPWNKFVIKWPTWLVPGEPLGAETALHTLGLTLLMAGDTGAAVPATISAYPRHGIQSHHQHIHSH